MTDLRTPLHVEDWTDEQKVQIARDYLKMIAQWRKDNPDICPGCHNKYLLYFVVKGMADNGWGFDEIMSIIAEAFDVVILTGTEKELPEGLGDRLEELIKDMVADGDDPTVH